MTQLVLLLIQLCGVAVSLICVLILTIEKTSSDQKFILIYCIAMFLYNLGYFFELASGSFDEAMLAVKMQYTGSSYGPLLYLMYVCRHCRIKIPKWLTMTCITVDTFILFTIFSAEHHHLYYNTIEFVTGDSGMDHLSLTIGPFYYIRMFESIAPMLAALVILIVSYHKRVFSGRSDSKKKYIWLICTTMIPLVAFAVYFTGLTTPFDLTPISTVAITVLIVVMSYKYKLFDVLTSAQEKTISNMNDGFLVIDDGYKFVFANDAAYKLFPELEKVPADSEFRLSTLDIGMAVTGEKNVEFEKDGRYYECHLTKLTDEEGSNNLIGYTIVIFDITEMKNNIKQIEEMKLQADEANRSKSTFLASMSHEIRTPMNAVVGMTELILREDINPSVQESALSIKAASESLLSIINDILDFSKIESGKMSLECTDYHFSSLMNDTINMINVRLAEKNLEFKVKIDPTIPSELFGDEVRVKQILINVLNNAVKFTSAGYIELSVNWTQVDNDSCCVNFAVTDTGIGIPKENMNHLFNSFERFDSRKNKQIEGTGLGLAITKQLLDLMGGLITVSSTYGVGSTFYFTIPQKIKDTTPCGFDGRHVSIDLAESEKFSASFTAPKFKVLIVDDNPVNLKVCTGLLKPYKINVSTAPSGMDCIKLMELYHYDIVLMDYMMPEMNGIDTLRVIRNKDDEYHTNIPVVVLTADAVGQARESFIKAGFDDYLSKPIDIKQLEAVLKRFIPKEMCEEPDFVASNTSCDAVDFTLDGVDIQKGLNNCGGDIDQYLQVLLITYEYGYEKIDTIARLKNNNDIENFGIEAHSLKSSAANIGAMELSAIAKGIEHAAKDGRTEKLDERTDDMLYRFSLLLNQISVVLSEKGLLEQEKQITEPEMKLAMPDNEVLHYMFDMLELVDEMELEAANDITKVLELFDVTDEVETILTDIRSKLDDNNRIGARTIIQDFIDRNRKIK